MAFPRWVPGSYFLREPIQHMFDVEVKDQDGQPLFWKRVGVDAISIRIRKETKRVDLTYSLLANELSVRSNHLDATHLHLMPPFTWFWPQRGIDMNRLHLEHEVHLRLPHDWSPATQLHLVNSEEIEKGQSIWKFTSIGRDLVLDSIIEANPNPTITHVVDGRCHHLKWWDSGGIVPNEERMQCFVQDMEKIIKEYHALFGVPNWPDYTTILHLTESGHGGLEHMNSQTSMKPRQSLFPNHKEDYRDLLSLFSHEYCHQWNVKRLRPKNFLDYDLQHEVHTDLLWWFEGGTSWLGDMICVRSGAWSEEDWRQDFEKKMKRHTQSNGMHRESLCESSHDAWIHLYRSGPYSRENQISYYLEGELAMLCLDAELRRRNHDTFGACDLMAKVVRQYAIDSDEALSLGVDYRDIRNTLKQCPGGTHMAAFLDRLVQQRTLPNVEKALSYFRLKLKPLSSDKVNEGWLGINTKEQNGGIVITSYHAASPLRLLSQVGDEILSVEGVRIRATKQLQTLISGRQGMTLPFHIAHDGVVKVVEVPIGESPRHNVTLSGGGNERWKKWLSSRQAH